MLPISQLKIDNDDLKVAQKSALKVSNDLIYTNQTINEFKITLGKARHDYEPYLLFFLAYVNSTSSHRNSDCALICQNLEKAARLFRRSGGEKWNEAITHWYLGVIYRDEGDQALATNEFNNAQKLLTSIGALSEWKGDYETRDQCWKLLQQINQDANAPAAIRQHKPIPVQYPFVEQKPQRVEHNAQLAFPIYDFVHAGTRGIFVFDDDAVNNINFEGPIADETKYQIFNIRNGNTSTPINIRSSGKYFWCRVSGKSMNQTAPIPIDDGDFILVNTIIQPTYNDIIVAALAESTSHADRAGVVKRFTKKGLVSESTEDYENISLTDADIRGVVIAVAKPIKTKKRSLIKIIVDKEITDFGVKEFENLLDNLAELLEIPQNDIRVIYITYGSFVAIIEFPDKYLSVFLKLFDSKHKFFKLNSINHVEARILDENVSEVVDGNISNKNLSIAEIRERITDNPKLGSKLLSQYLAKKPEYQELRDKVDTLRFQINDLMDAQEFGRTPEIQAGLTKASHQLLKICSQLPK